ncbi:LytR/AlgR family response regulator transcription factor, partial [Eubacterium aggregans]|uniref:LytR/AlgR family response regulator transcription factor n=1 Tax=Eubacterium aggregans TaxID=81409 RepID=UPI003F37B6A5
MKILVIDDEKIALKGTIEVVAAVVPEVEITGVRSAEAALKLMEDSTNNQIVFMDIEMRDMNGITLAKRLKVLHPTLNIIFTTGYSEYAGDAFSLHASGYIMKPITPQK